MLSELVGFEALIRLPPSANAFQIAKWVVDHALSLESPDVFLKVVRTVDQAGVLIEVQRLVTEIEADGSRWIASRAVDGLWAPPAWPFIDREPLRAILTSMAQGDGPAAMSIDGSIGHGKRTMTTYIRQLAEKTQRFRTSVAELRREPGEGVLDAMVADLRLKLELDLDLRTTHEEPERKGAILARDLAQEAVAAPMPVWFVANVLDPAGVDLGVMRFLDELIGLVGAMPELAATLRVLVLSESISLLGLKNLPPLEHRHELPEIDRPAVTQWLTAAVPGRSEKAYETTVEGVFRMMEKEPPQPPARLRTLALHCARAQKTLAKAQVR